MVERFKNPKVIISTVCTLMLAGVLSCYGLSANSLSDETVVGCTPIDAPLVLSSSHNSSGSKRLSYPHYIFKKQVYGPILPYSYVTLLDGDLPVTTVISSFPNANLLFGCNDLPSTLQQRKILSDAYQPSNRVAESVNRVFQYVIKFFP